MQLRLEGSVLRVNVTFTDLQKFRQTKRDVRLARLLHLSILYDRASLQIKDIQFGNGDIKQWACPDLDTLVNEATKFARMRKEENKL